MIHELKIYTDFFNAVISGKKTFEIRKNDRNYKVGDMLALNEWDWDAYTGNSCLVYVDYIMESPEYVKEDIQNRRAGAFDPLPFPKSRPSLYRG